MISASHNPYQDNGIKLFGPDGYKLSDEIELAIEERMDNGYGDHLVPAEQLGRAQRLDNSVGRYIEYAKNTFPKHLSLEGLKIVVDCANGAAYKAAPAVLWELGADVVPVGVSPNGTNINKDCGTMAPSYFREQVVTHGAHIGIALDGDADRVLIADEKGQLVDGDQLMALIAHYWNVSDKLRGGGVVSTVMSNLGLERYLRSIGLDLIRTKVGDRYVVEKMRESGYNIGGEQSGHIVLSDFATTGDGIIAALQVLAVVLRAGKPVSEACRLFTPLPQVLKNVRYDPAQSPLDKTEVKQAIEAGESRLNGTGRILIRKSGTEPVIRVMAEGEDESLVQTVVDDIVSSVVGVSKAA
jgi:phosphoglucosamine mutase